MLGITNFDLLGNFGRIRWVWFFFTIKSTSVQVAWQLLHHIWCQHCLWRGGCSLSFQQGCAFFNPFKSYSHLPLLGNSSGPGWNMAETHTIPSLPEATGMFGGERLFSVQCSQYHISGDGQVGSSGKVFRAQGPPSSAPGACWHTPQVLLVICYSSLPYSQGAV